jgi:hypothetical protein
VWQGDDLVLTWSSSLGMLRADMLAETTAAAPRLKVGAPPLAPLSSCCGRCQSRSPCIIIQLHISHVAWPRILFSADKPAAQPHMRQLTRVRGSAPRTSSTDAFQHDLPQVHTFRDRSATLNLGLAKYFNQRTFSDLTVVGPDGRKLFCHQVVLSACSKRFANMLEQGN